MDVTVTAPKINNDSLEELQSALLIQQMKLIKILEKAFSTTVDDDESIDG